MAKEILDRLETKGFASTNVVFGVGSYTYQYVTRDTWGFAVKATFGRVSGEDREIFKKPKTDSGEKNSAKGLVCVHKENGKLILKQQASWTEFNDSASNYLRTVYKDGQITRTQSLNDIRKLMAGEINE